MGGDTVDRLRERVAEAIRRELYEGCISVHDARWPDRAARAVIAALQADGRELRRRVTVIPDPPDHELPWA